MFGLVEGKGSMQVNVNTDVPDVQPLGHIMSWFCLRAMFNCCCL